MPSYRLINHADAGPTELATKLLSDGQWRLVLFAGDLRTTSQMTQLTRLCDKLARPSSCFGRYWGPARGLPAFEIISIISGPRDSTPLLSLHPILRQKGEPGIDDYGMVFSDEPDVYGVFTDAYGRYGVNRQRGCLVFCRPDQHVAFIGELEDEECLEDFCASVFVDRPV
jgi:phenol 2-monooxygenase (NADPH)